MQIYREIQYQIMYIIFNQCRIVQSLTSFALTNRVRGSSPFVSTTTFFRRGTTLLIFFIVPGIFATKSLCSAKCCTTSIFTNFNQGWARSANLAVISVPILWGTVLSFKNIERQRRNTNILVSNSSNTWYS